MVTHIMRVIKKGDYFYLQHSFRQDGKVVTREKYLGKEVPENVKKAVHACIQEKPTKFEQYMLYDPGAWPEPPICEKLSIRLAEPWRPDLTSDEAEVIKRMKLAGEKHSRKHAKAEITNKEPDNNVLLEYLRLKKKSDDEEQEH